MSRRYGLGPLRMAHRFDDRTAAEDAGVRFCQRFTAEPPFCVPVRSNSKWLAQIVPAGDKFSDSFLREITTKKETENV